MVGPCQVEPVAAGSSVRRSCDSGSGILTPATPAENRTWETKSDDAGHFHLDLPPGPYCLCASSGWGHGRALFQVVARQEAVDVGDDCPGSSRQQSCQT